MLAITRVEAMARAVAYSMTGALFPTPLPGNRSVMTVRSSVDRVMLRKACSQRWGSIFRRGALLLTATPGMIARIEVLILVELVMSRKASHQPRSWRLSDPSRPAVSC